MPQPFGHLGWRQARSTEDLPRHPAVVKESEEAARVESSLVARLTYVIIGLYALTFAVVSIIQHDSFHTHAFDLGNMDQAVWNTLQGQPFHFTNWEVANTRLAAHVEPILLLIAQFYRIYSSPKTLLVLQSIVISLGALPAFWLARDRLNHNLAGITFASAYLLFPALQAANLADFHAVSFSSSFLLFAFYFISRHRYLPFFLFATLAMSTKEQVPASVAMMGLYILVVQGKRPWGLLTMGVSLAWLVAAFGIVLPYFNPVGGSPYMSRYQELGQGPLEMLQTLISKPQDFWLTLTQPAKINYLNGLMLPVLYLPLLSPLTLVFILPDLLMNMLSNFPAMYSGHAHYAAVLVPYLVISATYGMGYTIALLRRLSSRLALGVLYLLCLGVLASSVRSYFQEVFLPLSDHPPLVSEHHKLAKDLIALIPPDAAVSSSSTLNPHVSQRQWLYLFPELKNADYVFLDVTSSPHPIDVPNLWWRVSKLLETQQWGVEAAQDGYLLLRKGAPSQKIPEKFYSFTKGQTREIQHPVDVAFGNSLRLIGFSLQPKGELHGPDPYAILDLYFQPLHPLDLDLAIHLFLLDADGHTIARFVDYPTTVWLPTSHWQPDQVIKVQAMRVPLGTLPCGDVFLGVSKSREARDTDQRLNPILGSQSKNLTLSSDQTLVRLTHLQRK